MEENHRKLFLPCPHLDNNYIDRICQMYYFGTLESVEEGLQLLGKGLDSKLQLILDNFSFYLNSYASPLLISLIDGIHSYVCEAACM